MQFSQSYKCKRAGFGSKLIKEQVLIGVQIVRHSLSEISRSKVIVVETAVFLINKL